MKSRRQRTVIAVLVAPPAAGLLMSLIMPIMEASLFAGQLRSLNLPLRLPEPLYPSPIAGWMISLSILIGIPATIVIGVPVHALMATMRWKKCWSYAIAGALCGLAFAVVEFRFQLLTGMAAFDCIEGPERLSPHEEAERFRTACHRASAVLAFPGLYGAAAMIATGVITAGLCWLIRRPDLDRPDMLQPNDHRPRESSTAPRKSSTRPTPH
jgi:hypothetical protein